MQMRTPFHSLAALVLCLSFMGAKPLHAYELPPQCHDATSTAEQIQCLSTVLEKQQAELNTQYSQLLRSLDGAQAANVKQVQTSWLAYRDLECALEATNTNIASLERLEALKCLYQLTRDRSQTLSRVDQMGQSASQLGTMPRWMNVLGVDNAQIYWDYAGRIESDLNCDGSPEYAMSGIELSEQGDVRAVVAIAESGATGKPRTTLTRFTLMMGESEAEMPEGVYRICNPNLAVSLSDYTPEAGQSCRNVLRIEDGVCFSGHIAYTEQGYTLRPYNGADKKSRNSDPEAE